MQAAFREKGAAYVKWAAQMAVGLKTGVPWIMCKQLDAPDPVVRNVLVTYLKINVSYLLKTMF